VHDKALYKNVMDSKFSEDPYKGPYTITKVNDNGTVKLIMGKVTDTVNIFTKRTFPGIIPLSLVMGRVQYTMVEYPWITTGPSRYCRNSNELSF
jgi:hypothetical protein